MCQFNEASDPKIFEHDMPTSKEEFDSSLYKDLCDAHCHPHDDLENVSKIAELKTGHITIMGVRQDDWDSVSKIAKECNQKQDKRCVPCFGIHPWFSHFLMPEDASSDTHYKTVLSSKQNDELSEMIQALPTPFPYNIWYHNLRQHLLNHPDALVGEVGVDRSARLLPGGAIDWHGKKPTSVQTTIEHQLAIMDIQCKLARELNRGISVHCVQGQGHLLGYLQAQAKNFSKRQLKKLKIAPQTLRMCLHSFGGAPATIKQFVELPGFDVFVSFSVAINVRLIPAKKLLELIKAVPEDRLLIESDLNTPVDLDQSLVEITKIVAEARGWSMKQVVSITHKNWLRFVNL